MKKILLPLVVLVAVALAGCSMNSTRTNNVETTGNNDSIMIDDTGITGNTSTSSATDIGY